MITTTNTKIKRMQEEIASLRYWMGGFQRWGYRNYEGLRNFRYSTLNFTDAEKQQFNRARDLIFEAQEIFFKEIFSKRLAKEVWDETFYGG